MGDFFSVSPSWNLLGSDGKFTGVPPERTTDPAHALAWQTHGAWRALWSPLMEKSTAIRAYAPSGAALFAEAYPTARDKILIKPHDLPSMPHPLSAGGKTIGVLGGINYAKGAGVLETLAGQTARRIVVIGEMDGKYRLPKPHVVHGRYDREQITTLARQYDVGLWLIPSICPETFSFATHEALATGLPVAAFNIGAQADALAGAANGHIFHGQPEDVSGLAHHIERLMSGLS